MYFELSDSLIHALRGGLLIAMFVAFAWALVAARRQAEQAHAQLGARLETALAEIHKLSGEVAAVSESLESLGAKLNQPALHAAAPPAASVSTRSYETAIRLARGGATVDEIVTSCGTTRAEARLLRRLHESGEPRRADAEGMRIA